ncbi:hypothetical protein [Pseudoduganella sp. HUAS MS19]
MENQKIESLLTEIRDLHRQHLEEYRRLAGESVAAQKAAFELHTLSVQRQLKVVRFYRFAVMAFGLLVACLMWFLFQHA